MPPAKNCSNSHSSAVPTRGTLIQFRTSYQPTILCIDDQIANLKIRTMLLEQFGCRTIAVPDHQAALKAVTEYEIDLLSIDYHRADGQTGER